MSIFLELFLTFIKIGTFTFGGGYAMIALIENICVDKKHWFTHEEMMDMTVIAESTPGPIAINTATFVGYQQAGFLGAVVSTLGMVIPSFLIITVIALFFDNFLAVPAVASAFRGIRIAVAVLILHAGVSMLKKMKKKPLPVGIMLCAFLAMLAIDLFSWNFSSLTLMLAAAGLSLLVFLIGGNRGKEGRKP